MSGFSFPPPPPPPPKASVYNENSALVQTNRRGRGNYSGNQRATGNNYRGRHDGPNQSGQSQSWHRGPSTQPSQTDQAWAPNSQAVRAHFQNQQIGNASNQNQSNTRVVYNSYQNIDTPPRTVAGHKRKLEALRGPQPAAPASGPPTAPSVPTFGAPILPNRPPSIALARSGVGVSSGLAKPKENDSKGYPRRANALGLTPGEEPHYSSSEHEVGDLDEDEDVDEEAMAAELGTKLTFEHNGSIISLSSPADLARWKSERLKNFPTRTRMAVKADEKRAMGDMRKRLLVAAAAVLRAGGRGAPQATVHVSDRPISAPASIKKHRLQTAAGNDTVTEVSSDVANDDLDREKDESEHILTERASFDHKPGTESAIDDPTSKASENATDAGVSSQSAVFHNIASETGHKNTLSESDDGAPESVTSKQPVKPTRDFPPAGKPKIERNEPRLNRPTRPVVSHAEKRGIYQALIEQEQHDQHVLALAVIKSLGKSGFFTSSE